LGGSVSLFFFVGKVSLMCLAHPAVRD